MATATDVQGSVVQIIGTVIDIEFPPGDLPEINNEVQIVLEDGSRLATEVQQHLGNNWVRALAMDSTDGLRRGLKAVNMGQPISVPVGPDVLGRMFNVLGNPIDNLPPSECRRWPIHRNPPAERKSVV